MHDRFHAIHAVSLKIFSFWNTGEHAFLWKSAHCRLPDFSNPGVCTKLFVWSEGREWSSVKSKNIIDGDDTTLRQIITKYSHFPFKSVCCFELLQANGFFLLFFCFSIHCRSRWDPLVFFSFLPAKFCWFIFIIQQHQRSISLSNPSYARRTITAMSVVCVVLCVYLGFYPPLIRLSFRDSLS